MAPSANQFDIHSVCEMLENFGDMHNLTESFDGNHHSALSWLHQLLSYVGSNLDQHDLNVIKQKYCILPNVNFKLC